MKEYWNSILEWDTNALIWARSVVSPEHAMIIRIFAESVVVWGAVFLVLLWLSGTKRGDNQPKITSLNIAFLIFTVFFVYMIVNLGLPQWRESPQNITDSIPALIPRPADNSFPSGHALFSGALLV